MSCLFWKCVHAVLAVQTIRYRWKCARNAVRHWDCAILLTIHVSVEKKQWKSDSPMKFWMLQTTLERRSEDVKNYTRWQRQIKHLPIIAGNQNEIKAFNRKEKNTWPESSPWKRRVILVLWLTLMQAKPLLPSVFFSIQDVSTKLVKPMKAHHRWTGWSRNKIVVLLSRPLQPLPNGKITV